MKKFLLLLWCVMPLWVAALTPSFYADHKSYHEGDILTVIITESSTASSTSGEKTDKQYDHSFSTQAGTGPLDFVPASSLGLKGANAASGTASTSRTGSFRTTMSVKVDYIDKNGNLHVAGKQSLNINGEEQITEVKGVVRPQDISPDNVVYSYKMAGAEISYKGSGTVRDGSRIGLISRIFNFIF